MKRDTAVALIFRQRLLTPRNALHKGQFEQQRFHAGHVKARGVVRTVFFAMLGLRAALFALLHKQRNHRTARGHHIAIARAADGAYAGFCR